MSSNGRVKATLDGLARFRDGYQRLRIDEIDEEIEYRCRNRIAFHVGEESKER